MEKKARPWHLYILRCKDGSLYTGITLDLDNRFKAHQNGKGAKYTRARGVIEIVYSKQFKTRKLAASREYEIKQLKKSEKLKLFAKKSGYI
jgi:putative endonuclease